MSRAGLENILIGVFKLCTSCHDEVCKKCMASVSLVFGKLDKWKERKRKRASTIALWVGDVS
jgi:hypothetical protein